jgi:PRC-barrel domain
MTGRRSAPLIGVVVALLFGGAAADPLPQGAAAPSAPDVAAPPDKAPPPVMEQNDGPAVAPKDVQPPEPQKPPPDAAAALPKNVEPVAPAQAFSVLGKKVHGPDGKDVIGSISDILVDDQGHPRAAVIDFGGFLGVGSRKIAVDWQLMKFHPTDIGARIVIDLDRSQIQAAPEYKDPTQAAEVVEPAVVGASPPTVPGTVTAPADQASPASPAGPAPPATPSPPATPQDTAAPPDAEKHPN